MIQPTVGRKVWFIQQNDQDQPHDATVCRVNEDGTVNLACHDEQGRSFHALNVPLLQDEQLTDYDTPRVYPFACWVPYQVGQARAQQQPAVNVTPDSWLTMSAGSHVGVVTNPPLGGNVEHFNPESIEQILSNEEPGDLGEKEDAQNESESK